ncbi:MAG: VanZ family protein [Neptuniibacter sp.]
MKQLLTFFEKYWLLLTITVLTPITVLSLYPLEHLPAAPGSDKLHHFIAYAALVFPVACSRPKRWLVIVAGFLAYSGLIELIQPYVNRYGEWLDLGANAIGLLVGILMAFVFTAVTDRKRPFDT